MNILDEKASRVKLLLLDVDGVMTNGQIILGNAGEEFKAFNIHDGLGINLLQKSGVPVGIITKRESRVVTRRAEELKIQYVYQAQQDKLTAFEELCAKLTLQPEQVAYMGDDLPDLALLKRVGFSATVKNAVAEVRAQVDFISQFNGGEGAVREICELIMRAQNTYQRMVSTL